MSLKEDYNDYKDELIRRYWDYRKKTFPNNNDFFDRTLPQIKRPPVFNKEKAGYNVIVKPDASQDEIDRLFNLQKNRHQWFHSMNSSQALVQSVLGNLAIYDKLGFLSNLTDDSGLSLMEKARVSTDNFFMEYKINHLGESRSTSLDGFFDGQYQVAIECKFTEDEVGPCSRPNLKTSASNYEKDHCNGDYTQQRERFERCTLTENGMKYWDYIPKLFKWQNKTDLIPCPLNKNYQLVRNILAVCVRSDENVMPENGHMVLIYDDRNPSFQKGGNGFIAIEETQQSLKYPHLLRTCSWQSITKHLRTKNVLPWLTKELELKYDL